jgi:hypothetical protein
MSLVQFASQDAEQPLVLGHAEEVINVVFLAPAHERLTAKAAVAPQDDPHAGPLPADAIDDPGDLLDAPAAASMSAGRNIANNRCSPQKMYK